MPAIERRAASESPFRLCIGLAEHAMIVLVMAARAVLAAPRRGDRRHYPSLCCFSRHRARSIS